jgi:hypothetical protein
MKTNILLIIALSLSSFADTLTSSFPTKYSFQLMVTGLLTVNTLVSETMISAKQMLNTKNGIRLSLGISASNKNYKYVMVNHDSVTSDHNNFGQSYSLHATYLNYLYKNGNIFMYAGIGPFGSYSTSNTNDLLNFEFTRNYSLGLDLNLGIEWFFTKHFSLFTEYRLISYYQNKRTRTGTKPDYVTTKIETQNNYYLYSDPLFIGLSIYLQ